MVSDHDQLVEDMIEEYRQKGYKKVGIKLIGYIPDAIMENDEEVVLLEAVDKHDHGGLIFPKQINEKPVRWDKRYCHYKRVFVKPEFVNKIRVLIQEYVGYKKSKSKKGHYGKARQLTIATLLTLEELRDALAEDYHIPIRGVGRPKTK